MFIRDKMNEAEEGRIECQLSNQRRLLHKSLLESVTVSGDLAEGAEGDISLCGPSWPRTHGELPASATHVLKTS